MFIATFVSHMIAAAGGATVAVAALLLMRHITGADSRASTAPPLERRPAEPAARHRGEPQAKYEKSKLDEAALDACLASLDLAMSRDRAYRRSDLSLKELADELGCTPHHLSQTINRRLGQNFYDFMNQHRIEEVKRKLIDPRTNGENILTLALDAGFNSKSTFNTAFKKSTGTTPSRYRADNAISVVRDDRGSRGANGGTVAGDRACG